MSKKLPLEIRRNYSIKDQGDHWTLKCDACSEAYSLKKPEKGKEIHGGNILKLLDHAASHPLPTEEDSGDSTEPIVELVSDPAPVSRVEEHKPPTPPKYSYPSEKHPNAYRVEVSGRSVSVSKFRSQSYTEYCQVRKADTGYSVTLFAANQKHASLIGQRLIERHCNEQKA